MTRSPTGYRLESAQNDRNPVVRADPVPASVGPGPRWMENHMLFLLWIIAVILVIAGIVQLVKGQMLIGIVLIIVGLLVGPGGVSIFNK